MAPADFSGDWKQLRRENEESFVEKLGIPADMRKKAVSFPVEQKISQDGDHFNIKGVSEEGDLDVSFCADGSTFEAVTPRGKRQAKSFWEGCRLVTTTDTGKGTMTMTREIISGEMHMTVKAGEAEMTIIYGKEG